MAVNKNFVVKNGLEVNTDLIFADATNSKVGIASTIPTTTLDVKGGIAATDINVSGVATIVTIRGTTGIVTTFDAVDVRTTNINITGITTLTDVAPRNVNASGIITAAQTVVTSATGTNLNISGVGTVGGNFNVSGDLSVTGDISYDEVTGRNLNITGISTFPTVVGVTTIGGFAINPVDNTRLGAGATVGGASGIVTYYGDGSELLHISAGVGVRTTGSVVGYGFTILNFIGAGNTFATDGNQVDISIAGGGGGGSISISSEAPSSPSNGDLWFHTEYARTFIWFDEEELGIGNTAVWVDAAPFNQGGKFLGKYGDNSYGAIGYTGGTTSQASIYYTSDPNTGIYFPAADHVGVVAGGTKVIEGNPNGAVITGVLTATTLGASGDTITIPGNLTVQGTETIINTDELNVQDKTIGIGSTNAPSATTQDGAGIIIYGETHVTALYDTTKAALGFSTSLNVSGFVTSTSLKTTTATITSANVGSGVTINNTGIDMGIAAGVCTALYFYGDGSNLTGIAAGGSGEFNTSISGATQYDVTTSMATAYTANASSDHRTIVHSIHVCNISASEVTVSAEIQASYSLAHTIPVPAGSALELLKQPKVLGPSETIELQASANSALEATIIVEYKEDTAFWDAQVDLTAAATMTDIYTSTTNPSVVQSILLANDDGSNDVKARVAWTDGSNTIQSYLVYDMVIPADSTVEICEKPKYLAAGYKLRGYANTADRLEITASGKQIVS